MAAMKNNIGNFAYFVKVLQTTNNIIVNAEFHNDINTSGLFN
jgi:hypothetical protein